MAAKMLPCVSQCDQVCVWERESKLSFFLLWAIPVWLAHCVVYGRYRHEHPEVRPGQLVLAARAVGGVDRLLQMNFELKKSTTYSHIKISILLFFWTIRNYELGDYVRQPGVVGVVDVDAPVADGDAVVERWFIF